MSKQLRIDFVSDVSCPWCIIGLKALEQALDKVQDVVRADIHFQPFELNPAMPAAGEDITEHLARKYGASEAQSAQTREMIRARGAELGGHQHALKLALFDAYFTRGENPGDHAVLLRAATEAGLDPDQAATVLADGSYADAVREREAFYQQAGINSVPAIIINERHLISGGQPVEVFEQALRQIATTLS